jgi:hypothetical protein
MVVVHCDVNVCHPEPRRPEVLHCTEPQLQSVPEPSHVGIHGVTALAVAAAARQAHLPAAERLGWYVLGGQETLVDCLSRIRNSAQRHA